MKFKNPIYIGDPINAVQIFNDKEVDELILLDITSTVKKKKPNYKKIEEIVSEAFMPVAYGGGVSKMEHIEKIFRLGIEKVILNSVVHYDPLLITEASKVFGSQSIVGSMDVKKDLFGRYTVFSNAGKLKQKIKPKDYIRKLEDLGCGELFVNSIDKDGTMEGYDIELIQILSEHIQLPIIVCGGASKIEHFLEAIQAGADSVAAGAMFVFNGVHRAVLISYPDQKNLNKLNLNNMTRKYQICNRCVMDTTDTQIIFDDDGNCNHCTNAIQKLNEKYFY